ncbi:MAG: hypothetical protein AB7V55_08295 [Oscillospiraceae bacterium]
MVSTLLASETPLFFDTLPALKARYFAGGGPHIYTLARFYLLGGTLQLSLSAFERTPAPTSTIALALAGPGGQALLACASPTQAGLAAWPTAAPPPLHALAAEALAHPLAAVFTRGDDEQGWFWESRFALGPAAMAPLALSAGGAPLGIALFKFGSATDGLGASHPLAGTAQPLSPALFARFAPNHPSNL